MFPPDRSTAVQLLREFVPIDAGRLVFLGVGDFCYAFRNQGRVFRIAKHPEAAEALHREACVLPGIADHLALPVPRPTVHATASGPAFTIHGEIRGAALTRKVWLQLPPARQVRVASELAAFLRSLHDLSDSVGRRCGLPVLDMGSFARRLREEAPPLLFPLLPIEESRRLDPLLARCESGLGGDGPCNVLLHCDIAPGHVLHDPRVGTLTGIIDFSDLALGDPARDFIYIYEDFGPEMLAAVLAAYRRENGGALLPRIRLWYLLELISWTLLAVRRRREGDMKDGIGEILRELRQPGLPFL